MSLHAEMTEEEFTEEMTHRVVKFGARSPESRDALRFSKRHPNSKLQKIARFKISEQERFDIENGLASPWVRVLHFLDEEVFDRLRLSSIGQVLAVSGFVLSVLFLSDRTRSWFGVAPAPVQAVISDQALIAAANQPNSPFDEWLNKELVKALESPQVRKSLTQSLQQPPSFLSGQTPVSALTSALMKDVTLQVPQTSESDEDLVKHLQTSLEGDTLTTDQKNRVDQWLKNAEDRDAVLRLIRWQRSSATTQSQMRAALCAWLESPVAKTALESGAPNPAVTESPESSPEK